MTTDTDRLDVLLIAEVASNSEVPTFSELISWIEMDMPLVTGSVKEQVESKYQLKDFLTLVEPRQHIFDEDLYRIAIPHQPSLALCQLATVLKAAGYSAMVIDNFWKLPWRWQQIEEIIESHTPRLIGISTTFLLDPAPVLKLVQDIKDIAPESKIVLGGPTARSRQELHGCADFVVFGQGERAILEILDVLDEKRSVADVDSIAFTEGNGGLQYTRGAKKAARTDEPGALFTTQQNSCIPISDWTLYGRNFNGVFSLECSRGCKNNCFYCTYDRGKVIRDLKDIQTELLSNARLGITKYRIVDANFSDGPLNYKRYPHDICQLMIDLDLGLQWSCYSRVDDLDDELAALIKAAGCHSLFFGIESGDDHILKLMRKGHSVADAYDGIAVAKRHGLFCHANFVVGFPGETRDTFMNTLEFIERSRPDSASFSTFFLAQHSPVYGKKTTPEFALQGAGTNWRHKTMDSGTAGQLVAEGMEHLVRLGIPIAEESEFVFMMSVGYSVEAVKHVIRGRNERKGQGFPPPVTNASPWLHRVAKEVARDQRAMQKLRY